MSSFTQSSTMSHHFPVINIHIWNGHLDTEMVFRVGFDDLT